MRDDDVVPAGDTGAGPDAHGLRRSSALTRFRLAPNPGPMSLEGTNSYVIGAGDDGACDDGARDDGACDDGAWGDCAAAETSVVVVDPGPDDVGHLRALAASGRVELVLMTHRHPDHTEAGGPFHAMTGAPVRALDPAHCHGGAPLVPDEVIEAAGVRIRVLATPGHTSDSVCLVLPDDGPQGSVLTGDTILGRGTTIIDYPDGTLGDYLESLEALRRIGAATVLPAHGPVLDDLAEVCGRYLEHRRGRLGQIREALAVLGADAPVEAVTDHVYTDIETSVRGAAEKSVAAQLHYLRG